MENDEILPETPSLAESLSAHLLEQTSVCDESQEAKLATAVESSEPLAAEASEVETVVVMESSEPIVELTQEHPHDDTSPIQEGLQPTTVEFLETVVVDHESSESQEIFAETTIPIEDAAEDATASFTLGSPSSGWITVSLQPILTLAYLNDLKAELNGYLGQRVQLVGKQIERVDTAALQLLTAFFNHPQVTVGWVEPSPELCHAAHLLGLTTHLCLPAIEMNEHDHERTSKTQRTS